MEYHTGIDLDVTLAVGHMIRDTVRHSDGATPPAGKIAQITVTTKLGGKVTFTVKVQKKASALKTKGIKMAKTTTLKKGETFDITTMINPVTTTDKMKFTLDKKGKKVISVSRKGLITAKNPGTAKLTIKVGSKKMNKKYVRKYKKIFTKANAGKKVRVR